MKKLMIVFMLIFLLTSCKKTEEIKMIVPYGSTQFAQLYMQNNSKYLVDIIQGPDPLVAAFATSSYDVIFAPTNLGAKMYQSKDDYQLLAVITWGNFYLISMQENTFNLDSLKNKEIILFGQNQTADIILKYILNENDITASYSYLDSILSVQSAFILDQSKIYLVAEPIFSNLLSLYPSIKSIDLQLEYKNLTLSDSYPQAGVFIHKNLKQNVVNQILTDLENSINNLEDNLDQSVSLAIELGFSLDPLIVKNAIMNSHIKFVKANDAKSDIIFYFNMILEKNPNLIGSMLPGDDFYYKSI
jgi:NitT/TauT family transport system substrate-binding protein